VTSTARTNVRDVYTLSANGQTAGSYTNDGRWNIGGWATYPLSYPLRNEPAFNVKPPPSAFSGNRA
jgi:hypothetical protein